MSSRVPASTLYRSSSFNFDFSEFVTAPGPSPLPILFLESLSRRNGLGARCAADRNEAVGRECAEAFEVFAPRN
jgi:hypothetical protein